MAVLKMEYYTHHAHESWKSSHTVIQTIKLIVVCHLHVSTMSGILKYTYVLKIVVFENAHFDLFK